MSVIIKGVSWPTSCKDCFFCRIFAFDPNNLPEPRCLIKGEEIPRQGKLLFCPLVEIPTPHGRLIEDNKVVSRMVDSFANAGLHSEDYRKVCKYISQAPTILEAEGGDAK